MGAASIRNGGVEPAERSSPVWGSKSCMDLAAAGFIVPWWGGAFASATSRLVLQLALRRLL